MDGLQLLSGLVPPDCATDMRKTLGLSALAEAGQKISVLRVGCTYEIFGATPTSELVIFCARPMDDTSWNFGTCFPQMPGDWAQGNYGGSFHLRFLGLESALWVYVWTRDAQREPVEAALKSMALFQAWATDTNFDLDKHGLEATDLQEIPRKTPRVEVAKTNITLSKPSWSALFMWGGLADSLLVLDPTAAAQTGLQKPASVNAILGQVHDFIDTTVDSLIFRAKVVFDQPDAGQGEASYLFRRLLLETPPITQDLGKNFKLRDAAVFLTAPLYYSRDNARVGIKADLVLPKKRRIHLELDYPLTGDLIRASGRYVGDPEHLLGDDAAFGMPGAPTQFGADTEIGIKLMFSKTEKTLDKLMFDLELQNKDWTLIPDPIELALDGVAVEVMVRDPLAADGSRMVQARLGIAGTFGGGDTPVRLLGGGRYPEGDIYLQSSDSLPVGKLLEKLVGPTPELEKFTVENLRLDHNTRSRNTALSFDVPEIWELSKSVALTGLQFRVGRSGLGGAFGGATAQLRMDMGDSGPLDIMLSALYTNGWQFEGATGPGQKIPIGHLFSALNKGFGGADAVPACIEGLAISELSVFFDTATRDFNFDCLIATEIEGTEVLLELGIAIAHHKDPTDDAKILTEKRLSGIIRFEVGSCGYEFDVAFGKSDIVLPDKSNATLSTFLASFTSTAGPPPSMRDFAPSDYRALVPDIATRSAFIVKQGRRNADNTTSSKILLGLSLEAGLDLSKAKLPNLPLVGSGGPPKSLKLDLQILLPAPSAEGFTQTEINAIGNLNASGGASLPDHAVEGLVVASSINIDGKVLKLNLPLAANPTTKQGEAAFKRDTSQPIGGPKATAPVPNMVAGADDTKWIKVQKNFGPIHIERLGLKYASENLFITLDAGLTAAGFTVSLQGLGIDTPLSKFDPHFHILGMGLEYDNGGIKIGGAFLKQDMIDPEDETKTYTSYGGEAVLQTPAMSLSALGSFANHHGESSLFVYAELDTIIGGPAFFFVTGLAAGFGYHRRAIVPAIDQIYAYPLVTKAVSGPVERDALGSAIKPDLVTELGRLEAYLPPDPGSLFFALGVKFTSFEMVDSFALMIAQFGDQTAFDVLGVSNMQVPSKSAGGSGMPLAEIYMNWHGYLHPDEGSMGLEAQLAPGSYVFSRDCHLTGGFAYSAWFGGENEGEFVLTVGGYHKAFHKPEFYPVVPRLGFNWALPAANLSMKGELYFALTAHAFMAGGTLNASIHGGFDIGIAGVDFHADLSISADFLITWEPYHYDGSASLDLDIGLTAHLLFFSKSFSLNVGGDIHIWGPDFAGEAKIHLKVWKIRHTFDITFGAGPSKLLPVTWDRFAQSFLPKVDAAPHGAVSAIDPAKVCGVSIKAGLVSQSNGRWVVNPREFCLETNSMIPSTTTKIGDRTTAFHGKFEDVGPDGGADFETSFSREFGVAPMGLYQDQITSTHHISILRDGHEAAEILFRCEPILKRVPAAMWGPPRFSDDGKRYLAKPEVNAPDRFIDDVIVGLRVLPANTLHPTHTDPIDRRELLYDTDRVGDAFVWRDLPKLTTDHGCDPSHVMNDTLPVRKGNAAAAKREAIAKELGLEHIAIRLTPPLASDVTDFPKIEAV